MPPRRAGAAFDVARLPFSLKVILETLLRTEAGEAVNAVDIEALAGSDPAGPASIEIAFTPSRVLMQDFTGVPAIVDLPAMQALRGDPTRINPQVPVELVIDTASRSASSASRAWPTARDRQHVAGVRLGLRHLPGRLSIGMGPDAAPVA
jgi:aconitase A